MYFASLIVTCGKLEEVVNKPCAKSASVLTIRWTPDDAVEVEACGLSAESYPQVVDNSVGKSNIGQSW